MCEMNRYDDDVVHYVVDGVDDQDEDQHEDDIGDESFTATLAGSSCRTLADHDREWSSLSGYCRAVPPPRLPWKQHRQTRWRSSQFVVFLRSSITLLYYAGGSRLKPCTSMTNSSDDDDED